MRKNIVAGNWKMNTTVQEGISLAQEVNSALKGREDVKCDVVICVSHMGWADGKEYDANVIQGSRYIDLVLGGHTHTYMKHLEYVKDLDGHDVPVDQNGKHAIYVGRIVMNLK